MFFYYFATRFKGAADHPQLRQARSVNCNAMMTKQNDNGKNKKYNIDCNNSLTLMSCPTNKNMTTKYGKIKIDYKGKQVTARKLTVTSEISIDIDTAWSKVQTSALLEFVADGKVRFNPTGGHFPDIWKEGDTVSTKMLVYGFVPFGGLHSLYFEKIDTENKILQSREWDNSSKVWNHKISLKKLTDKTIIYEDEIVIYGGILTGFITSWAKSFYKHRQKRWQLVATNSTLKK